MFHHFKEIGAVFCCRNDENFTFQKDLTIVSAITGYERSELNNFIDIVTPESRDDVYHCFKTQLSQVKTAELLIELIHKNSEKIWCLIKAKKELFEDGNEYIFGTMLEVSKFKKQLDVTNQSLKQYQIILSQTENIIYELDCENDSMFYGDTWYDILGYEPIRENFIQTLPSNPYIYPEDIPGILDYFHLLVNGETYKAIEIRLLKSDGNYLWFRVRATAMFDSDGKVTKIVGVILNIDKEKNAQNELKIRAEQDSLTSLLNKHTARFRAEKYLKNAEPDEKCAFLFMDLDNFKNINDHYGHMFGDQILIKVSQEIKKLFRSDDIIARLGGDEFMVLMKSINDLNLVKKRCAQILESFEKILSKSDFEFTVGASIGVAYETASETSFSQLFDHADQASYEAKRAGRHQFAIYED